MRFVCFIFPFFLKKIRIVNSKQRSGSKFVSVRERNSAEHENKSLTVVYRFVYSFVCRAVQGVVRVAL